jgi:hypothetical protein
VVSLQVPSNTLVGTWGTAGGAPRASAIHCLCEQPCSEWQGQPDFDVPHLIAREGMWWKGPSVPDAAHSPMGNRAPARGGRAVSVVCSLHACASRSFPQAPRSPRMILFAPAPAPASDR